MSVIFENYSEKSYNIFREINFISSATSDTTSVTVPSGVAKGDLILFFDYYDVGDPAGEAVPTGFTKIQTANVPGTIPNAGIGRTRRSIVSYKIATGNEGGTSISGMAGGGGAVISGKSIAIARPNRFIINTLSLQSSNVQPSSNAPIINTVSTTITSGLGTAPLITYTYSTRLQNTSPTLTPTQNNTVHVTAAGDNYTVYSYIKLGFFSNDPTQAGVANVSVPASTVANTTICQLAGYLELS